MSLSNQQPHDAAAQRLSARSFPSGLRLYQAPTLLAAGIPHAFTTRGGGVSASPFASLNLGNPPAVPGVGQDAPANLERNYQLLQRELGLTGHARVDVQQVHGPEALTVRTPWPDSAPRPCGDALVTDQPGLMLTIRIADCLPLLLASRDGSVVAAVHAGWRGLVAGVIPRTLQRLAADFQLAPSDTLAALGPCISVAHFEVGPEVAAVFTAAGLAAAVQHDLGPKPHADLAAGALQQLLAHGIPPNQIDLCDRCTWRDHDEFFSHRRAGPTTGRMAAVIATAV